MKQFKFFLLIISFFGFTASNAAVTPQDNQCHFLVAPYSWLTSLDGNVTVKGNTVNAHVPFSKILKNLDFAGEAHIEAARNRWTFMLDPTYLQLSKDVQTNLLDTTLISKTTLIDTGLFYQLLSTSTPQPASLEVLGGARYLGLDNELEFKRISISINKHTDLLAPIVGLRLKYDPVSKIHLWLRGDYGGLDVDDVRDTWSSTAGISYTIHKNIDLVVAYRALGIKFIQRENPINVVMYGPMLGIAFYT